MIKPYELKPSPERNEFRKVAESMLIPVVEFDLVHNNGGSMTIDYIDFY